jgi:hypothetical protein
MMVLDAVLFQFILEFFMITFDFEREKEEDYL